MCPELKLKVRTENLFFKTNLFTDQCHRNDKEATDDQNLVETLKHLEKEAGQFLGTDRSLFGEVFATTSKCEMFVSIECLRNDANEDPIRLDLTRIHLFRPRQGTRFPVAVFILGSYDECH